MEGAAETEEIQWRCGVSKIMGQAQRHKRTHVKNKAGKAYRTKRRTKDIDQIQDEIRAAERKASNAAEPSVQKPLDPDLPGLGYFDFWYSCAHHGADKN